MKHQALFSSKDKIKKKIKCRLLQFSFGALRVSIENLTTVRTATICLWINKIT